MLLRTAVAWQLLVQWVHGPLCCSCQAPAQAWSASVPCLCRTHCARVEPNSVACGPSPQCMQHLLRPGCTSHLHCVTRCTPPAASRQLHSCQHLEAAPAFCSLLDPARLTHHAPALAAALQGRFVHVPPIAPSTSWDASLDTPWWKDKLYRVGGRGGLVAGAEDCCTCGHKQGLICQCH